MSVSPDQLRILVDRCEQFRNSKAPGGYPNSFALCIVDSVQSTGVTYSSVVNVRQKYRTYRSVQGGDAETDGANDLMATFAELGGADGWAAKIGNGNRTSTKAGAPLKAAAIEAAALSMVGQDIIDTADLREAALDPKRLSTAELEWRKVPGQKSGVTWHYVQILAGIPGVKPDRMIIRFVADTLGLPRNSVSTDFAGDAVRAAAAELGISASDLDHGIWQWQRRR